MKMYVWSIASSFQAAAHDTSVEEARKKTLAAIGEDDGSCPERAEALAHVKKFNPMIFQGSNAEFALVSSAEAREATDYGIKRDEQIRKLKYAGNQLRDLMAKVVSGYPAIDSLQKLAEAVEKRDAAA